jgi:hypothetical protein
MAARITVQKVRNSVAARAVPAFPIEYFTDLHTGQRLPRECPAQVHSGHLIIGSFVCTTGIDLYYRRSMGNPREPQPGETDCASLLVSAGRGICAAWAA